MRKTRTFDPGFLLVAQTFWHPFSKVIKKVLLFLSGLSMAHAQDYPPAAGNPGSTAIPANSPSFIAWASRVTVVRGPVDISNPEFTAGGSNFASAGQPEYATGAPDGNTVSLGDGGSAVLSFALPIVNADGFDFAVFENGSSTYLELAFVEASSDGVHFFRFTNHSQTQTDLQLNTFGSPLPQYLNNLAGKYEGAYGTPFDLSELPDDPLLDKQHITHIKVIDVVGSVNPFYANHDSYGNWVNDSFPTPFTSCGFDLQAVGVIHQQILGLAYKEQHTFRIYPNPVKDVLFTDAVDNPTLTIFDVQGKLMLLDEKISVHPIDLSILRNSRTNHNRTGR